MPSATCSRVSSSRLTSLSTNGVSLNITLSSLRRRSALEFSFSCLMRQVVTDVGKEGALRPHGFHDLQRLLYGGVRGMGCVAQRIEKKYVEIAQLLQRLRGDVAVIGQIRRRSKTKSQDRRVAMNYRQRLKARPDQFNRPLDRIQVHLRQPAKLIRWLKNVGEHIAQKVAGRSE